MEAPTIPDYGQWLTTTEAARALEVSTTCAIKFHQSGQLTDVIQTPLGRLFNPEEVEFLRQQRAEARAQV